MSPPPEVRSRFALAAARMADAWLRAGHIRVSAHDFRIVRDFLAAANAQRDSCGTQRPAQVRRADRQGGRSRTCAPTKRGLTVRSPWCEGQASPNALDQTAIASARSVRVARRLGGEPRHARHDARSSSAGRSRVGRQFRRSGRLHGHQHRRDHGHRGSRGESRDCGDGISARHSDRDDTRGRCRRTNTITTPVPVPCGDVNGDGVVNIGDALVVAQFDVQLRQCSQLPHPEACDVNRDGACNIDDALRMAQCDVGLISCVFTCNPFACP